MKIVLISMPDVTSLVVHESAFHMPNLGIATIGGNIDDGHEVFLIDLIRKRNNIRSYLTRTLKKLRPDMVGLSAMAWQYDTCTRIIRLIRQLLPRVRIVIGGYHATLMYETIAASPEAKQIDFMIRGEGEETFRRLVNALEGKDRLEKIPSLSYKTEGKFVHNERGELLDLSELRLPIRDKRRLTWGYHLMHSKMEVMETSRGCTRACKFCSMNHMYGRTFRTFPIERVLADLDDIYHNRKTRWAFIVDDNLVLNPRRVIRLCDAIIGRKYKGMNLIVQADCVSMSRNEEMVRKMSLAGVRTVFLGIENVSEKNLAAIQKGNIVEASKQAVAICHKYGLMVIGGLVFGFPDDDEAAIIQNYEFFKALEADAAYFQILTPYPKTRLREDLMEQGLITNPDDYRWYNGVWANVRTRYLDSDELHYLVWYHRQKVIGWWDPSDKARANGKLWTSVWRFAFRPVMRYFIRRTLRKHGWEGRYQRVVRRLSEMNTYKDLEDLS